MIFLSLGAGVQSSVMLMRALRGDIEQPHHVIFADTGWEPKQVYNQRDFLRQRCADKDVPFHIVHAKQPIRDAMLDPSRWVSLPVFVRMPDGHTGILRRQCTHESKIGPILRKQRELLGYKKGQRIPPAAATVMLGFTTDEARRARPASEAWIDRIFPLIDPLRMSRDQCRHWWHTRFPAIPLVKSACIGCPYRTDQEWAAMKNEAPEEFEDACIFDDALRETGSTDLQGVRYLHRSCVPLRNVPLNEQQLNFEFADDIYCAGGCGL